MVIELSVTPRIVIALGGAHRCAAVRGLRPLSAVKNLARAQAVALLNRTWCQGHATGFTLRHEASGQPFGEHLLLGRRHVSLSHSLAWYASATGDIPLGIDLQHYRPFSGAALRWAFSEAEQRLGRIQACAVWAIREAFLKSHGRGLPYELRTIGIDWRTGLVSSADGSLPSRRFWLWRSLDWTCALCFPAEESMSFRANVTVFSLPAPSAFGALS
ncbi:MULTISPECIES: 4'-phosphopantetheinyl transferase superfamily protein [Serratia]|uniref:4'-phosphopantetheinyl transferase superfamily protein n=1 Tax=Serratia marcescens TaxID=615 RepID=A0A5C7CFQ5_SERMA|nr:MULTISPECIES: 4'-phosphopantetheinyl transferase superfamily protein [Serratia]MBH3011280.1 4'-phosphopantetheinyl transferase superfamily protein [Serratia marcescens]MBN5250993.1 4'-phosphopantetheinyl transferase superfamily protein [Serratia marcescens]MBN5260131.1 4'-phosphopantetheinyl transferase superfamily protein [Serratia marcescens]MBN5356339.1 4'-phosphopantetheinyl transferase superfamily protein [Serratia marcescens]MDM8340681.1 4'-phosphopantetheinyl transferase superfamily 